MKKIMTNVAIILLIATGTAFAQTKSKTSKSTQNMESPKTEMDTTMSRVKTMQGQGQMQIKDTLQTSSQSNMQNSKAEMDTTQSGMNRMQQSMNQTGTKDSTQTQGNSAGGTSAWPMATGTAGGTMEKSDTLTNKKGMQSNGNTPTQSKGNTQTQGNSAGGTSAWPQSTGTAASTTPDSTNQSGNVADNSGKKMKGDKKHKKNKGDNWEK